MYISVVLQPLLLSPFWSLSLSGYQTYAHHLCVLSQIIALALFQFPALSLCTSLLFPDISWIFSVLPVHFLCESINYVFYNYIFTFEPFLLIIWSFCDNFLIKIYH